MKAVTEMSNGDWRPFVNLTLNGDAQKNAGDFFEYLAAGGLQLERGGGYWADKLYWMVKYENTYICFVLIDDGSDKTEPEGWVVWTDEWDFSSPEALSLDAHTKETAWRHIDICGKCGGCSSPGGSRKTVLGKAFDNVCITTFRFDNPDAETVACIKRLVELRKRSKNPE